MSRTAEKSATLYRMMMPTHTCPYGLKAMDLLSRHGYQVDDRHLSTKEMTDTFKAEHDVRTTPQIWLGDEYVGGLDALKVRLGYKVKDPNQKTYRPVIAIFAIAALMAVSLTWLTSTTLLTGKTFEWFIALSMCFLAVQKLQNVETFSTMFLNYDLLAKRWVRYGYVYPYGEAFAGISMLSGALIWLSAPIALTIGTIGAVSVFKAVYIEKRDLKCACVGGDSNVPLGFISLTENLMMMGMGSWMLFSL